MGEDKPRVPSPHQQGLLEIMRARLTLNADGEKTIDRSILATVHVQNIDRSTHSGGGSITPTTAPSAPPLPGVSLLEDLLPRVTKFSVTHDTLEQMLPTRREATETLEQLQRLMKEFAAWEWSLPRAWSYKTYSNPNLTRQNRFPAKVIIFPTLPVAGMRTAKWLAQLSVLRSMMVIALAASPSTSIPCPSPMEVRGDIRSIVGNLCSSIPYLLGHVTGHGTTRDDSHTPAVGALFATRSLYVISKIPHLPEGQMSWIMDRLGEIGQEKGIRRALLLQRSIAERRGTA